MIALVGLGKRCQQLGALIDEVLQGGEVLIIRDGGAAVRLQPASRPGYGSLKGQIIMAPDFDAPLEEFAEYAP